MNTLVKLIFTAFLFVLHFNTFANCNDFVPGQVLVKFKENKSSSQKTNLKSQLKTTTLKTFPKLGVELWEFSGDNKKIDVKAIIEQHKNHPDIEYIEPNYIYKLPNLSYKEFDNSERSKNSSVISPNDPLFYDQWYLNNIGQLNNIPTGDDIDINAPEAWDIASESPNVKVAILDSGVEWTHKDLNSNIWQNLGEDADGDGSVLVFNNDTWSFDPDDENGIDDDGNGYADDFIGWDFLNDDNNPNDDVGHGTQVAGVIGAEGNNNIGIAGVTWNVEMAALKIFGQSGAASCSKIIDALEYAIENEFPISNNSWGGGNCEDGSRTLSDAIEYARNNDHLFIASAGNAGSNNDQLLYYPASYDIDNIIAVAAIGSDGELFISSNYGVTSVDIAAPGQEIRTTSLANNYGDFFETNAATPQVTGACALIKYLHPNFSYNQLKNTLLNSVTATQELFGLVSSNGRLDLFAVLTQAQQAAIFTDVYPGDLNNDGIVDGNDALFWGLAEGLSGPPRLAIHQNTDWYPHPAQDWPNNVNGINCKYQDADGNGTINDDDLMAVQLNIDRTWVQTIDVYPGDLNNDGFVNKADFCLSGAVLYETGPPRASEHRNTDWYAHPAEDWGPQHISNQDYKHFDCNGDGVVDQNDHQAVEDNMGQMRNPSLPEPELPPVSLVFPGDLNHDGIVNVQDVGLSGLFLYEIGPARAPENRNTNWYPHQAEDWNRLQLNDEDIKHFDCNGDGVITEADAQAVIENLGLTWTTQTEYQIVLSPVEEINEDYLRIQVALENTSGNDIVLRGSHFTIDYGMQNQNIINSTLNFLSVSWLGIDNLNLNTYSENFSATQKIEAAFSRNDGIDAVGSGVIAELILQVDNSTSRLANNNCMVSIEVRDIGVLDTQPMVKLVENRILEVNMCEQICESDWYIDDNTPFQNVYTCSDSIITNGFVMVSDSQQVKYLANHIQLNSGFKAKAGADFSVDIQPCE